MIVNFTRLAVRIWCTYFFLGSLALGAAGGRGDLLLAAGAAPPVHTDNGRMAGGVRAVAMNGAEISDGILPDDYEAVEEDWAEPVLNYKGTKKKQRKELMQSEIDKDDIFQQGETRDFLAFLRRIKYDHRQCPINDGGPVFIDVSIVVSNIRAVSEVTMDYALEMFYRETWTDDRLDYDKSLFKNKTEISLHESYTNFLWHPDTFMPNAIASKNPQKQSISHRSLLRLQEKGRILYSRRISVVAECPMDLVLFPFDTQICKLGIESYGYTADQVVYQWSKGSIDALKLSKIRLPDFQVKEAYVVSQIESYATGDYSRLYVCFVFNRASGFCFLQLIIPSTAVVITSWVALWMESETEFQDMISIILAITFLIFSYNEMMPRVSYLKALDIWLAVCFMIVFLSLIKLALVKFMRQKLNRQRAREASVLASMMPGIRANSIATNTIVHENGGTLNGAPVNHEDPNSNLNTATLIQRSSPPYRSCSVQYTAIPIMSSDHQSSKVKVDLFGQLKRTGFLKLLPKFTFTSQTMHRFHWITQMMFFFGFVTFALLYFLLYPNLHYTSMDPACDKTKAEYFAPIL